MEQIASEALPTTSSPGGREAQGGRDINSTYNSGHSLTTKFPMLAINHFVISVEAGNSANKREESWL